MNKLELCVIHTILNEMILVWFRGSLLHGQLNCPCCLTLAIYEVVSLVFLVQAENNTGQCLQTANAACII